MQTLQSPVDLIWGERDPWEPLPEAKRWADNIDCVQSLQVIAGAGHCPHDEAPDQVNKAVTDILSRHSRQNLPKPENNFRN